MRGRFIYAHFRTVIYVVRTVVYGTSGYSVAAVSVVLTAFCMLVVEIYTIRFGIIMQKMQHNSINIL